MNRQNELRTLFASAERATQEEIQASAQLFGQMDLLRTALDAAPEPVLILNEHRQAVYINDQARQVLEMKDWTEALGQRPGELLECQHAHEMGGGCGASEACSTCGALRAVLAGLRGSAVAEECRLSLESGESLDFRMWARPFEVDGTHYVICAVQDISDEKRRRALEQIFFHDVLNTASILSTYTQLLEMSHHDLELVLRELRSAADRLIDEIKTQQQLVAAEHGELKPQLHMIDVHGLVSEAVSQYERRASHQSQRHFDLIPWPDEVYMMADPVLLRRVLSNMLKNAVEATKDGETITIAYHLEDDSIVFSVKSPPVMPRHVQLQMFKRSFSTKGEGRGLGTYSIKLLSERYMQGRVWFESTKARGTTFFARYPLLVSE